MEKRNRISHDVLIEHYWFHWIRKYGNPNKYKQRIFGGVLKDIHTEILKLLVNEQFSYKMPYTLGRITVKKYKPKVKIDDKGNIDASKLRIDWGKTNKYWAEIYPGKSRSELKEIKDKKLFYHLNKHTNGYVCRFVWTKWNTKVTNIKAYKFYPVTGWLDYLSERLREDTSLEYYEM